MAILAVTLHEVVVALGAIILLAGVFLRICHFTHQPRG